MKLDTPVHSGAAVAAGHAAEAWSWRGGLQAAYASEVGAGHVQNEDCCAHVPSGDAPRFCGVADGVGGGAHGEIASSTLLAHCARAPQDAYCDARKLAAWLTGADAEVREAIARRSERPGAATLAAAWFASPGAAMVANVGDCRAYRLRPSRGGLAIEQLTADQTYASFAQRPPQNGSANDPARMVGAGAMGEPQLIAVRIRSCELLLLCSDGVHKFVGDQEIAGIVSRGLCERRPLRRICAALVGAAKVNGSLDDASALLVLRRPWFGVRWLLPAALIATALLLALNQAAWYGELSAAPGRQALWDRALDLWRQMSAAWGWFLQ